MTITLPEWFVWLLSVLAILQALCSVMDLYQRYLTHKWQKMLAKHGTA